MNARPYKLIGHADMGSFKRKLHTVLDEWASEWLGHNHGSVTAEINALRNHQYETEGKRIQHLVSVNESDWCAISSEQDHYLRLGWILAGGTRREINKAPGAIIYEVVESALADLAKKLLAAGQLADELSFTITPQGAPADVFAEGAGGVGVFVDIENIFVSLILPFNVVHKYLSGRSVPKPDTPLESLKEALKNQPVNVKASLGFARINLGELATLEVGDVIRMDQRIDQPTMIRFSDSSLQIKGYLGKQKGSMALKVISVSDS